MASRKLIVEIIGDDASLKRALGNSGRVVDGFGNHIMAAGARVSAVGKKMTRDITLPVVAAFGLSIHASEKLDKAVRSLETGLHKNGIEVDANVAKVRAFAAEQARYGVEQDKVIQGVARGVEFSGSLTKAMKGYQMALVISKATGKNFDAVQTAVNKTLGGSTSALSRYIGAIEKGTPLHELYNRVMGKFGGQAKANTVDAEKLKAKFENLAQNIGTLLLPAFDRIVDVVSRVVEKFDSLDPSVKKTILIALALAATIGPLIHIIGALTTAVGFLAANPIVLLVTGVAVLVAAIAAAVIWPDKLKRVLERMGLSAHAAGRIVAGLREAFAIARAAALQIAAVIEENWPQIKAIALEVFGAVKTIVITTVHVIEAIWAHFGTTIIAVARNAWDLVKATIRNGLEVIRGIIDIITGLIRGDWGRVWKGIKETVGGAIKQIWSVLHNAISTLGAVASAIGSAIWNGLKNTAIEVINWIIGKLRWVIDQFNAVAGWALGNIPAIPYLGGDGSKGPAGPHGPSAGAPNVHGASKIIAMPPAHAANRVVATSADAAAMSSLPTSSSSAAARAGAGGSMFGDVHIHLDGTYIGGKRQLEDEVTNALGRFARRNGLTDLRAVLGAAGA